MANEAKTREFKAEIKQSIEAKDHETTAAKRKKVRRLKRKIRRHMHLTH